MPSNNEQIHWDPTDKQLELEAGVAFSLALEGAGWITVANDGPVAIFHKTGTNRFYVEVRDRRRFRVASALCYSSSTLGEVASRFKSIAEVL